MSDIHVCYSGAFGELTASILTGMASDISAACVAQGSIQLPAARAYVFASWRPAMAICTILNAHCYRTQSVFVPAVVEDFVLRIGPIIVPGTSACWECWVARFLQHDLAPSRRTALWRHYDDNPDSGPIGYLNGYAATAAARIASAIRGAQDSSAAGSVWEMDMLSRQIVTGTLCGVDGCTYCGQMHDPKTRSYAAVRTALSYLWDK